MMDRSPFSETYEESRRRFDEAAVKAGATLRSYPVEVSSHHGLSIDVAILGREGDPTLLLTSGVHGVEGFMGSAIQLAFLDQLGQANPLPNIRVVLVHGINPFGFSQLRRTNEENVDLNRNFRTPFADYEGAPPGYASLDPFLNPKSAPRGIDLFRIKTVLQILRMGLSPLKNAIAGGQFEYPDGLFFGGKSPCRSTQLVQEHCDSWLASSQTILHLDFHSGLGPYADYKMLVTGLPPSRHTWFGDIFGADKVEDIAPAGVAFEAAGIFGEWMQRHFCAQGRDYCFAAPEFGTYGGIRVLGALRAENRAHHHCAAGDPRLDRAKRELLECFCPADSSWRAQVIESGLEIIARGASGLSASVN